MGGKQVVGENLSVGRLIIHYELECLCSLGGLRSNFWGFFGWAPDVVGVIGSTFEGLLVGKLG